MRDVYGRTLYIELCWWTPLMRDIWKDEDGEKNKGGNAAVFGFSSSPVIKEFYAFQVAPCIYALQKKNHHITTTASDGHAIIMPAWCYYYVYIFILKSIKYMYILFIGFLFTPAAFSSSAIIHIACSPYIICVCVYDMRSISWCARVRITRVYICSRCSVEHIRQKTFIHLYINIYCMLRYDTADELFALFCSRFECWRRWYVILRPAKENI